MITYRFSQREKALILALVLLIVGVVWFKFVYEYTTDQILQLEEEISGVESSITVDETRLERQTAMQQAIERHRAMGSRITEVPNYDNIKALMSELDMVMKRTGRYSLSFDALDTESTRYVLRGVGMQFTCASYEEAETVLSEIANGAYPCVIDSLTISHGTRVSYVNATTEQDSYVSVSAHVTFFERPKA